MIDCVICLQIMKPPIKVLSCGHSFCLRCIRQIRRQIQTQGRPKLICPTCRQETRVPRGRTSLLPNNYALHDILDKQQQQGQGQTSAVQLQPHDGDAKENPEAANGTETTCASASSASTAMSEMFDDEADWDEWNEYMYDESEYDSGNWYCPNEYCGYYNYSFRHACRYCRVARLDVVIENVESPWIEAMELLNQEQSNNFPLHYFEDDL